MQQYAQFTGHKSGNNLRNKMLINEANTAYKFDEDIKNIYNKYSIQTLTFITCIATSSGRLCFWVRLFVCVLGNAKSNE